MWYTFFANPPNWVRILAIFISFACGSISTFSIIKIIQIIKTKLK